MEHKVWIGSYPDPRRGLSETEVTAEVWSKVMKTLMLGQEVQFVRGLAQMC